MNWGLQKKAKINVFLTFFHQIQQPQKRGMKSEEIFSAKKSLKILDLFRPLSKHA